MCQVIFRDADHVVPNHSTTARSDDKIEIESNSTEEFFEVEEIFSNTVDVQEVKKDYDVQMVHTNETDYIDHQTVWKEDADPPTFQRCKSFVGSQNFDKKMDCNIEAVKDITVDDITFKTAEKVDSGLQVVKDIVVDYGDKKPNPLLFSVNVLRRMAIKELIDDAYDKLEGVQHKGYGEDTAIAHLESKLPLKKLEADAWRVEYEKLQSASRKQPSSTVKLTNHTTVAKQKTKQPEDQNFIVKQAKPNTLSRWISHEKESCTNSMHLFYPSTRQTVASPTSISSPTKDSYSYSTSKPAAASAISGLLLSETADEQKSNKTTPKKPLSSAAEILTSKPQSPLGSPRPLPNTVLHQDPTLPLSPTTLLQPPALQANTSFFQASSPKSSLSPSSYFHKNARSPPPAPPPPPPPPSNHAAPKSSLLVCGNKPKQNAPPAPPPPPIRRAHPQLPLPRPLPSHGALLSPRLSDAGALPPPPPPPPPIQRTAPPHLTQGQPALTATTCVVTSLPSPICEASSPPQPTTSPLPMVPSSSQPSGGVSPHLGAKGVSSSTDMKTAPTVRGRGFLRSMGIGVATPGPQRSSLKPLHWSKVTRVLQGSLWEELQRCGESERYYKFSYESRWLVHSSVKSSLSKL